MFTHLQRLTARYENEIDDGGYSAGFSAGIGDEPAPSNEPASQPVETNEPAAEAPLEAGNDGGADDGSEGAAGTTDPAAAGDAGGEAPATQEPAPAVAGDGGVPADNGQPQARAPQDATPQAQQPQQPGGQFDPATMQFLLQTLGRRQGQPQQPQAQQPVAPGQPAPQAQAPQAQQPQAQQAQQKTWQDYLTDEQRQALQHFDSEWSEVSEAVNARTQAMLQHQRETLLAEVQRSMAPFAEHFQRMEVQSHFDQIRSAHEDFDDLRGGKLQEWVGTISNPFVRQNAEQVLVNGSSQDVIDLIDFYKQQTGAAPAVPASSSAPAAPVPQVTTAPQAPATPPKPKPQTQATKATAAVPTGSRGADPRGHDHDDFSAAFRETAASAN